MGLVDKVTTAKIASEQKKAGVADKSGYTMMNERIYTIFTPRASECTINAEGKPELKQEMIRIDVTDYSMGQLKMLIDDYRAYINFGLKDPEFTPVKRGIKVKKEEEEVTA